MILISFQYQNDPMQQTDEISALPNELKCLVWSYLDKQADKLMFALTCKWNAATYEGLKNKQTQPAFKKVSPKSKVRATPSKKTAPPKKKPTDPERLEVLWRLQKWEPLSTKSIYKLCYKCICFIPRSYIFYPEKNCPFNWGGRHVDLNAPKMKTPKARTEGYRCPECSAFTAGQMVSGTKEYEEAERTTRKALDTKW